MDKTYYLRVAVLCQSLNLAVIYTNIICHLTFQLSVFLCSFLSKGHLHLFIQIELRVLLFFLTQCFSSYLILFKYNVHLVSLQILRIVTHTWW